MEQAAAIGAILLVCGIARFIQAFVTRPKVCVNCQATKAIIRRRRYKHGVYNLCTQCWLIWIHNGEMQ